MKHSGLWIIAGVALLSLAAVVWLIVAAGGSGSPGGTATRVIETPMPVPSAPEPSPAPERSLDPAPPPTSSEPTAVPDAAAAEAETDEPGAAELQADSDLQADAEVELPSLNDSDGFVRERLQAVSEGPALLRWVADEQLIRKFVVFVENISRHEFPQTDLPYRAVGGEMPVRELDQNLFLMEADAHTRFDTFIDTMTAVSAGQALALYRVLRPLFQQAYAEIGYRGRDFDDALRRAINNVLQASDVEGPYQLVKPSVMYLFADSELENADAVQKQLIRIGPRNSTRLMAKLAEFVVLL